MNISWKPALMGGLMGLMMLWMMHGILTGGTMSGWAAVAFVGAHVAVIAGVVLAGLFASRLSPRMSALLARVHRPSLGHISTMLGGAAVTAIAAHFVIHGGII